MYFGKFEIYSFLIHKKIFFFIVILQYYSFYKIIFIKHFYKIFLIIKNKTQKEIFLLSITIYINMFIYLITI